MDSVCGDKHGSTHDCKLCVSLSVPCFPAILLLSQDCYNRWPQTGCLLFFTTLEAEDLNQGGAGPCSLKAVRRVSSVQLAPVSGCPQPLQSLGLQKSHFSLFHRHSIVPVSLCPPWSFYKDVILSDLGATLIHYNFILTFFKTISKYSKTIHKQFGFL